MKLGFIGTGKITSSIITGICKSSITFKKIFISQRNIESITKTLNFIMQNYESIQKEIEQNKLPLEEDMFKQIAEIIKKN